MSSVNISRIDLQVSRAISNASSDNIFHLSGGTVSYVYENLTIALTPQDAAKIKLHHSLAKNISTSFLSVDFGSLTDYAGNYLAIIPSTAAFQATKYVNDTVPPVLEYFSFDLSPQPYAQLLLNFSEPILASSFNFSGVVIQSRFARRDGVFYRLTGGSVLSGDGSYIILQLSASDVINIKLINGLARSSLSTYLTVDPTFATDLAHNAVQSVYDGYALLCTTYTADITAPQVTSVAADMTAGTVSFTFDEPVILSTVVVSALTVQSQPYNASHLSSYQSYQLTTFSSVVLSSTLSLTVVISFGSVDLNSIKGLYPLLSKQSSSWFSFTNLFAADSSYNYVKAVAPSAALPCSSYVVDQVRPYITYYSLDMNAGMIYLKVSEAVLATSINMSELVVQSVDARRFGHAVNLSSSTYTIEETFEELVITIAPATLNEMKYYQIGYYLTSSYLSWSDHFLTDTTGNDIIPAWDASIYRKSSHHHTHTP